jgi:hypothetical protein
MERALEQFVWERAHDRCEYCQLSQGSRHFRWDGPCLVGRTPIGRATVNTLRINLNYRMDLRQGLIEEGEFPPR